MAEGGPKRMADHNSREIGKNYNISLQERNELVKLAERYLGYHSPFVWNANINRIIIQLRTNDCHLDDLARL